MRAVRERAARWPAAAAGLGEAGLAVPEAGGEDAEVQRGSCVQRIVIIVIAVAALVVGGWSAVWFSNRSTVEDQMRAALDTLSRAGAQNQFESIEISGFPFSYRGEVSNLVFTGQDADVRLPTVAAEVSIDDTDTVRLLMPPRFTVTTKSATVGGPTQTLDVEASALALAVSLAGDDAYDLSLSGGRIKGAPQGEGPLEPFEIEGLTAAGVLKTDPEAPQLELEAAAESYKQRFLAPSEGDPPGPPEPGEASFAKPTLSLSGSAAEMTTAARAETLLLAFDAGGVLEVRGLAYDASARAKERFDAAPLAGAADFEAALEAFTEMATRGVLRGGAARASVALDSLRGSGVIDGGQSSADVGPLAFSVDFGAERVGFEVSGDKILVDAALPDDQAVYYDVADIKASFSAAPAEAFDFSQIAEVPPARYGELFVMAIWGEVLKGGALELASSAGPSVTRAPTEPGSAPFRRVESAAGPSSSRIALTPEAAVVKATVDGVSYRVSEGVEGGGAAEALELDFFAPLKASPEEQTATLLFRLEDVTLDEGLWAAIDPEGALTREIEGVRIGAQAGVTVQRDVLSPEGDVMNLANPVAIPGSITVADTFLDMFGLRADLAGDVAVFPLPTGALTLDVAGWPEFLEAAMSTPMGADPQTGTSLIILNDLFAKYSAPADASAADATTDAATEAADAAAPPAEGATRFRIEIGPAGLTVNGRPYEG